MSSANPATVVNLLIDGLSRRDRDGFVGRCEPVEWVFGTILCEPEQRYRHVYFPLTGFISLVAVIGGHPALELGLIGNEGMLGATLVLDVDVAPLRAVVQGAGSALRMSVAQFRRELRASATLRRMLNRYLFVTTAQLSQTAACTRFHEADARLARWLLMTHDRAHSDSFFLTHQYLADMLGVQRSAVSIAAGALQRKKLIRYSRGEIRVLNRHGLEAASCECYAAVIKDYRQRLA